MRKKCVTFSAKPGHVRICERDENGLCVKDCKDVRIEELYPNIAIELKKFETDVYNDTQKTRH